MSAGRCKTPWDDKGLTVDSLVQNSPGLEKIEVQREVIESKQIVKSTDEAGEVTETCVRQLTENLKTTVRGIQFVHSRTGAREEFGLQACNK